MRRRPMIRRLPGRMKKKRRRWIKCGAGLLVLIMIGILFNQCILPSAERVLGAQLAVDAQKAMNEAIKNAMDAEKDAAGNMVCFMRNDDGQITGIQTDTQTVNRIKTAVLEQLNEQLGTLTETRVKIPLGSLSGIGIFSGMGPQVGVKMISRAEAETHFLSAFTSAGINQTRHRIILEAGVTLYIVLPGKTIQKSFLSEMNLCDNLIVGNVPQTYTYIDDTRGDTLDKINDYAAQAS